MQGLKVNGESIGVDEIRAETARLRGEAEAEAPGRELSFEQRVYLRNEATGRLIERLLIGQEAARLDLSATDEEVARTMAALAPRNDGVEGCRAGMDSPENVEDIRRRLGVDKLLAHWFEGLPVPTAKEIKDYYKANRERFWTPDLVRASHMAKPDRAPLEALRARVVAGEDFATVAAEGSDCPDNGGDLGYFAAGTMVPEFDAVVFAAPVGQVTPVFETPLGFHFALVVDKKPAGIRDLKDVYPDIESMLMRAKQDATVERNLGALHAAAVVEEVR